MFCSIDFCLLYAGKTLRIFSNATPISKNCLLSIKLIYDLKARTKACSNDSAETNLATWGYF